MKRLPIFLDGVFCTYRKNRNPERLRLLLLTLLLFGAAANADVSGVGTPCEDFAAAGTDWTSRNVTCTVPTGATLFACSATVEAPDDPITAVAWDTAGVNEALTLVDQTTSSGSPGDVTTYTWAVVSPTDKTADVTFTVASGDVSRSAIACSSWDGTVTDSVAAATNFLAEDVTNTNGATLDIASGGTSGNHLYVAGGVHANDAHPVSLSTGWNNVATVDDAALGTDVGIVIADKAAASDITMTLNAGNEHAGHMIELVAAAGAEFSVSPSVTGTTDSSYTVGFTTDIDATVHGVACATGRSAPTGAQVVAGDCGDDLDADSTCTEPTTGSVADSCTLSGIVLIQHDLYFIACPESGVCE